MIFHVDMDAFFVSVEELYHPALRGNAVVIGGKRNERGVVAAASYAARKFGIHSAMPLRTAAKLAPPEVIFMDGHPERYREYSEKIYEILKSFSPLVEMVSVDEAYLDMRGTERLLGPPLRAAALLHEKMKAATNLNCSIGIAASRLMAKVASDEAKPNGIFFALPGCEPAVLAPLHVRKLPGIGKVMERELNALGIRTLGDLVQRDQAELVRRFGDSAKVLRDKALGRDAGAWFDNTIGEDADPKSISHEHTFATDTNDPEKLESMLVRLSEMVGRRLREQSLYARTIQLKLRYAGFVTITRAKTLAKPTALDTEIFAAIRNLFRQNWNSTHVRLLGVHVSSFADQSRQFDLLREVRQMRWSRAMETADKLRDKYGESTVVLGSGMGSQFREKTHENPAGLPGKFKSKT